ncbi:Butyryl-CoA dehydrogenase [Mycolicibacterium rhodesiae JS60]|nr:Butyryl-CoA dehydrogenase [Mycolicibacterium rhodesiae JS60]
MDFDLGEEMEALRADVRQFCATHVTTELRSRTHATGTPHDPKFARMLGERGWVAPGWPKEEGGRGHSWVEQFVLREEFDRAEAPISGLSVTMLVANTLRLWGTDEQKQSILPRAARGEIVIVLGYSEAGSGSDVAAARTSATRQPDGCWEINGEKMFTTHAHVSDYIFLLTCTDSAGPKRRNLTMFLIPSDTPGVAVHEIATLGGERTNVTSYTNVRVPDSARVGEVNGAWAVLSSALMFERASTWAPALDRLVAAASSDEACSRDPQVASVIARAATYAEVSRLLALKSGWTAAQGKDTTVEGPMAKLFSTEAYARIAGELMDAIGPGCLTSATEAPRALNIIEHAYRQSQVTTIYGGTSEVQRSIIAERGLGLPRSRTA